MYLTQLLKEQLVGTGFVKRGKAFFRVWGDGILQVIRFKYEAHMSYRVLSFGFQSMYGDLLKQYFTSSGCNTEYGVSLVRSMNEGRTERIPPLFLTAEEQFCLLKKHALPFLDSIKTQSDLGKAYCALDEAESESITWGLVPKMDAFLAAGEYDLVDKVVSTILRQHLAAWSEDPRAVFFDNYWAPPWTERNYLEYEKHSREEDIVFLKIHRWIASKDQEAIQGYLKENYERNCKYAKFCLSGKRSLDSKKDAQKLSSEQFAKIHEDFQMKERAAHSLYRSLNLIFALGIQESNHLREKYISTFVNTESQYYKDQIETLSKFSDGMCYTGYLWDCLKNPVVVSQAELVQKLSQKRNIYIMQDIHSQDNVFMPNHPKFSKESVLKTETWSEEMLEKLPEDIYIFDETFTWSAIYTHETDINNAPYCLYID